MTRLNLWARITGKDKRKQFPQQQAVALSRVGDYSIIFPYGIYADLPDDALTREIDEGISISVTIARPDDTKRGEPAFFHPVTNTRIIPRNDGSLDIITEGGGSVNIVSAADVTVSAGTVNLDATVNLGTGGLAIARVGDAVQVSVVGGSSAGTHTGVITSGGGNTST